MSHLLKWQLGSFQYHCMLEIMTVTYRRLHHRNHQILRHARLSHLHLPRQCKSSTLTVQMPSGAAHTRQVTGCQDGGVAVVQRQRPSPDLRLVMEGVALTSSQNQARHGSLMTNFCSFTMAPHVGVTASLVLFRFGTTCTAARWGHSALFQLKASRHGLEQVIKATCGIKGMRSSVPRLSGFAQQRRALGLM